MGRFFSLLYEEINPNIKEYKFSISEFDLILSIYKRIIINNITKNYFDLIIINQKNEFNYKISYYYRYIIHLINSTHQFIINRLPRNQKINQNINYKRSKDIDFFFNDLINNITNYEKDSLNMNEQINFLQTSQKDFFNLDYALKNNIIETNQSLNNINDNLFKIDNFKINDDYSIISKLYLENLETEKYIKELYEPHFEDILIYLNTENYMDLINNYFVSDSSELINQFNNSLYNINIENEGKIIDLKKVYQKSLENQINKYIT